MTTNELYCFCLSLLCWQRPFLNRELKQPLKIRKLIFKALLFLFICNSTNGQNIPIEYASNIALGDSFYMQMKYELAAKYYNKAFRNKFNYSTDFHRIQAANTWVKLRKYDSAFVHLNIAIYTMAFADCANLSEIFQKTDLISTQKFKKLMSRCLCQQKTSESRFKSHLAVVLDSIYNVDQATRSLAGNSNKPFTDESATNFSSLKIVDSLYNLYGWLSATEVGFNASQAQFLVIQHSDKENMKKRFERIDYAVNNCLLSPEYKALLQDRILILSRKRQLYGTQLRYNAALRRYEPYPIRSKRSVNARRYKMGMISLELYLSSNNN